MRLVVLAALLLPATVFAQKFNISLGGKPAGTASYTLKPSGNGFSSTAVVHAKVSNVDVTFSKNETLDSNYEITSDFINGTVSRSAVTVKVTPNGQSFAIEVSANGQTTTNSLSRHPDTVLLSDFDPGALEILLHVAAAAQNQNVWLLVPKQNGLLFPAQFRSQPDTTGKLNGQIIPVHHLTMTVSNLPIDIFSTDDKQFLQEEVPAQGFALIREGFELSAPAKAPEPPNPPPAEHLNPQAAAQ